MATVAARLYARLPTLHRLRHVLRSDATKISVGGSEERVPELLRDNRHWNSSHHQLVDVSCARARGDVLACQLSLWWQVAGEACAHRTASVAGWRVEKSGSVWRSRQRCCSSRMLPLPARHGTFFRTQRDAKKMRCAVPSRRSPAALHRTLMVVRRESLARRSGNDQLNRRFGEQSVSQGISPARIAIRHRAPSMTRRLACRSRPTRRPLSAPIVSGFHAAEPKLASIERLASLRSSTHTYTNPVSVVWVVDSVVPGL